MLGLKLNHVSKKGHWHQSAEEPFVTFLFGKLYNPTQFRNRFLGTWSAYRMRWHLLSQDVAMITHSKILEDYICRFTQIVCK